MLKSLQKKLCFYFLFFLLISSANAAINPFDSFESPNKYYFSIAGGVSNISLPDSTTVPNGSFIPVPYNRDTYSIQSQNSAGAVAVSFGGEWQRQQKFLPYYSLGIQYTRLINGQTKGSITQFSAPGFENYNYKFNVDVSLYTLIAKFDLMEYKLFLPYVSVGVGSGYNRICNYTESTTSSAVTPRTSPSYVSNDNVNFIYTLGVGVDYKWTDNVWFTLGYEFENLGNVSSGSGMSSWSAASVDLGTLRNNMIFAAVSYHFPSSI